MSALHVNNLAIFHGQKPLVNPLSFTLQGTLGIIGESGSGKSLTCKAILGLLPRNLHVKGEVYFQGELLQEAALRTVRGRKIGYVTQDAMNAFDPLYRIGAQFHETLRAHGHPRHEAHAKTNQWLEWVGLPSSTARAYPHELSGGMLQRAMIALVLALEPHILIADEPTSALDTLSQYRVIELLKRAKKETSMELIIVSHDLGVVRALAKEVLVMHQGQCVEQGALSALFSTPTHPYTRHLVGLYHERTAPFLGEPCDTH